MKKKKKETLLAYLCSAPSLLLILLIVIFAKMLSSKCWKKGLISLAISALTVLLAVTGLDLSYNTVLRGEAVRHSGDSRFLLTMIFYTAERSVWGKDRRS